MTAEDYAPSASDGNKPVWSEIGSLKFGDQQKAAADALFQDINEVHGRVVHGAAIIGCMSAALMRWVKAQPEASQTTQFMIAKQEISFPSYPVYWDNEKQYLVEMLSEPVSLDEKSATLQLRLRSQLALGFSALLCAQALGWRKKSKPWQGRHPRLQHRRLSGN